MTELAWRFSLPFLPPKRLSKGNSEKRSRGDTKLSFFPGGGCVCVEFRAQIPGMGLDSLALHRGQVTCPWKVFVCSSSSSVPGLGEECLPTVNKSFWALSATPSLLLSDTGRIASSPCRGLAIFFFCDLSLFLTCYPSQQP